MSDAAPKGCPHAVYETPGGWACKVCGNPLLRKVYVSRVAYWAARRKLRRAINDWRNE